MTELKNYRLRFVRDDDTVHYITGWYRSDQEAADIEDDGTQGTYDGAELIG